MLPVWWDIKSTIYYELLPAGTTIDLILYCSQLTKLDQAIRKTRPKLVNRKRVVFHHDNARPHTSLITRKKLFSLGWDVLPCPPYSPDIAPSNYHLFRSLQNSMNGKTFKDKEVVKNHLDRVFADKPRSFYERGIMKLVERWQEVIDKDDQYITD
ncbi:Mariner Mos1 transposase [Anthophora plagiata]